jgi:NAD+ kinase
MSAPSNHQATHRPRTLLLADGNRPEIAESTSRLRPTIERYLEVVDVILDSSEPLPTEEIDLLIVLGGDGSILRAARRMGYHQIPVLGINLGHLGFLADLRPEQLEKVLPSIASGQYCIVEHLMFQCELQPHETGITASETAPSLEKNRPTAGTRATRKQDILGLNEVAVLAGPPFAIVEVQLYVDGSLATTYSCDGLIVSTPVGSTAHNLSAGGPILRKEMQAFVISPISPHTLTNRPVVDSAEHVYELMVPAPHAGTSLVVDGQVIDTLSSGDRIRIRRSTAQFQLIEVPGHGYYQILREKLGWSGRLETRGTEE